MTHTILRIDASARYEGSYSRQLVSDVIDGLRRADPGAALIHRDLAHGVDLIDEAWVQANFTQEDQRTDDQRSRLEHSDELVEELFTADTIVLGVPIYNFSVPGALKAWIDLVARARKTFRYSEAGPEGLLTQKRVILVMTSGGTAIGGDVDFATAYLKHVLGFLGLDDISIIDAGTLMFETEDKLAGVRKQIAALLSTTHAEA